MICYNALVIKSMTLNLHTSARLQDIRYFDCRCDPEMRRKFQNVNCSISLMILLMNFKLHTLIIDGRMHDSMITDFAMPCHVTQE